MVNIERTMKRALSGVFSPHSRKYMRYILARSRDVVGINYFPAHNDLDRKLLKYVGHIRHGTFIEAGANDGLSQSNTWHLEKRLGWNGLLIEPIPQAAALCAKFRRAPVESCALGSFAQDGSEVALQFGSLMTTTEGADTAGLAEGDAAAHAAIGASWTGAQSYTFMAPVRTISGLLDKHGIDRVNLFSLDVEGFEVPVLSGIDFDRHRFDFILIETSNLSAVQTALEGRMVLVDQLSHHDYLFKAA